MFCEKCNNELKDGEKFCGKCGEKVKTDKKGKIKILISMLCISAFLVVISLVFLYFYGKNIKIGNITIDNPMSNWGITDKYLTNNFKENGWDKYDDVDVHILAITNIEYNDFNKLVLAKNTVTNNGTKSSNTGILFLNRKDNTVEGLTTNSNLIWIFNGLVNNTNKAQDVLDISAKYIQEYGTEIFTDVSNKEFGLLVKDISNVIGVDKAREYTKSGKAEQAELINSNLDCTLLFEKESAKIEYYAFYEKKSKFNSKWPIDENTYKYFSKDYSMRDTLNTFEYVYGEPYVIVEQYTIYTGEGKSVGTYLTLDEAKNKLNVE